MLRPLQKLWKYLVFRYAGRNVFVAGRERARKFYNLLGRVYGRLYEKGIYQYAEAVQRLADANIRDGETVLDVGCGAGAVSARAAERAAFLAGIDLSIGMIREARKKTANRPNCAFAVADCRHLPLRGQFDKIVSSFMMVLLDPGDQLKTIRGFRSLIKPEGEILFLTATESRAGRWLDRDGWMRLCAEGGFEVVSIEDFFDDYRIVRARPAA